MQTIHLRITPFRASAFAFAAVLFGFADKHNPQVLPIAILLVIVANLIWNLYGLFRSYHPEKMAADAVEIDI